MKWNSNKIKEGSLMSMEINTNYANVQTQVPVSSKSKVEEKVAEQNNASVAATYEKSADTTTSKGAYSINKMSQEDRDKLVSQLKADQAARESSFLDIVQKTLNGQVKTFGMTSEEMWRKLASGDFTVDAETKAQAQKDISEDGYWGVKQTSQRLFDFASALAGDDPEKMKKMQDAMEKGFKEATKTWGKNLPDISQKTIDAANKLFEDYYKSKNSITE